MTAGKKSQSDKFKEAARQLETDDDEERFNESLRRIAQSRGRSAMKLPEVSDDALFKLHEACRRAYSRDRSDRKLFDELSQAFVSHGVDDTSDWPWHVQQIENEMTRRELDFVPVETQRPTE